MKIIINELLQSQNLVSCNEEIYLDFEGIDMPFMLIHGTPYGF